MLFRFRDADGNEFKVHKYGLEALDTALKEARFEGEMSGKMTVNEVGTMKLYLARMGGFKDPHVRKHLGIIHNFIRFLSKAVGLGKGIVLEG